MLGSLKLLIFGIVSALVLSLVIVGSFAAEPEEFIQVSDLDSLRIVPQNPPAIRRKLFDSIYTLSTGPVTLTWTRLFPSPFPQSVEDAFICTSVYVYRGGIINTYLQDDIGCPVYYNSSEETLYFGETAIKPSRTDFSNFQIRLTSDSNSFPSVITQPNNRVWEGGVISPVFGFFTSLFESILTVGSMLVSFVVARPIVLAPIVVMLGVFAISVVRRLIKGV